MAGVCPLRLISVSRRHFQQRPLHQTATSHQMSLNPRKAHTHPGRESYTDSSDEEIGYGGIEFNESMVSVDDFQTVLTYNHARFILVMKRPANPGSVHVDVLEEWFQK